MDLLIVCEYFLGYDNKDRVYLNDGMGQFTDSGQRLGSYQSHDVKLGDFDGDNDLDAVIACQSYQYIWKNDGLGSFTKTQFLEQRGSYGLCFIPKIYIT